MVKMFQEILMIKFKHDNKNTQPKTALVYDRRGHYFLEKYMLEILLENWR